jgi:hypothetical protein
MFCATNKCDNDFLKMTFLTKMNDFQKKKKVWHKQECD